jgi:hypothetical protein
MLTPSKTSSSTSVGTPNASHRRRPNEALTGYVWIQGGYGQWPPIDQRNRGRVLSYRGMPSWRPTWTWIEGQENKKPKGEIGTLTEVRLSVIEPPNRSYLVIHHEGSTYMGCLFVNDLAFYAQLTRLLQYHCGNFDPGRSGVSILTIPCNPTTPCRD